MTRKRRPSDQALTVLAALAAQPKAWRHGYDLAVETGLKSGTLYPILMRLEERSLLQANWEEPGQGRAPRHQYRLTAQGVRWAKEQLAPAADTAAPHTVRS
ncbi:MAG TPA: helix-turn-helix transcriptional regulator [Acetobacteraceae bacterium]|jgi:PadR family transcriptional regulator PadR|nr:helix-turn-helix transcriptional regulator [Acetobacteraceae bacterium]